MVKSITEKPYSIIIKRILNIRIIKAIIKKRIMDKIILSSNGQKLHEEILPSYNLWNSFNASNFLKNSNKFCNNRNILKA